MKTIQLFSSSEELIISETKKMLQNSEDMKDATVIEDTLKSLYMLAESISNYPSLLNQQELGKHSRTLETLVENLCSHPGLNLLLSTPTKAILGKGFTIAKMNFFILISYICADYLHLCSGSDNIKKVISLNVFSIMAEEVFISIISDDTLDVNLRTKAGFLLAKIWEYRVYKGIEELEPVLTDLWISRQSFTPSFGTMQGITEITSFCADRNPMWLTFLSDNEFNEDTLDSLKEYLMGLSYEEIMKIEDYMESESISSFNMADIEKTLGLKKSYPMKDYHDPREMYHFYARRKNNAIFRKKSCMRGPTRTIEEYIICYMLKHELIKTNGN
ncbi:MAG TPA: hypothetical protein PKG60_02770 [Spirochaetota bacterium]|nr:hypothetical protein [Spirochaetota bacterium]HPS87392.1 hypothetical protein [Spirochaetota bacterium]